jgi:hypothetical protein
MTIPLVNGVNPLQTTLTELGIVSGRVALLLRSAEIQPVFVRFVLRIPFGIHPLSPCGSFATGAPCGVRVQHAAKGISISKSMYAILADAIRAAGQCMCYLSTLCASCCYRECLGMVVASVTYGLDHLVRFQMVSQDTVSWLNHLVRIQIKRLSLCLLSYCIVFNHSSVTV